MKIKIGEGYLDLMEQEDISMDVVIAPVRDIETRNVSYTNAFDIPKTQNNIDLIDPELKDTNEFEATVYFENGNDMLATIYVNTGTTFKMGNKYSISIVDEMARALKTLEDGFEELFDINDDTFTWRFREGDDIPTDDTNSDWFITTGNFNGEQYDTLDEGYPVYTCKYIGGQSQLMFTMNFYIFLNKALAYANIPHKLTPSSVIMWDGVTTKTLGELYIYMPTNFVSKIGVNTIALPDPNNRNMLFGFSLPNVISPTLDSLGQTSIQSGYITGNADTIYDISVALNTTVYIEHRETNDNRCFETEDDIVPISGNATLLFKIFKNDELYKTLDTGIQLGINESTIVTESLNVTDVELLATDQLSFQYAVSFNKYTWDDSGYVYNVLGCDYISGNKVALNGVYKVTKDLGAGLDTDYFSPPRKQITNDTATITMINTLNLRPALGIDNPDTSATVHEETIYIYDSVAQYGLTIKEVMNTILNRFNLIFYVDSQGFFNVKPETRRYHIIQYGNEYNPDYGGDYLIGAVVIFGDLKGNSQSGGFNTEYSNDFIGEFSYKNKKTKRIKDAIEIKNISGDDKSFSLGDVYLYEDANGDVKDKIQLTTAIAIRDIYGEYTGYPIDADELLEINPDDANWGLSAFTQLDVEEIGLMHGFISDTKKALDLRCAVTSVVYIDTVPDPDINFIGVEYKVDAGIDPTSTQKQMYTPLIDNTDLHLGDENGYLDPTTLIYTNFERILTLKDGNYITINLVLTNDDINNIIDGYKLILRDGSTDVQYRPTYMNGVMVDKHSSVVELKIIKE